MKLNSRHPQDFETYLNNIGLKDVTKKKHLLYFRHFTEMFDSFVTQKTIDSFLQQKTSPNHRAMIKHLINLLKRDSELTQEEEIEVGRLVILKQVGRKKKNIIRIVTPVEFNKLVEGCSLSNEITTERFKLMMQWQYSGGLRVNELCSLKFEDLMYKGRKKFFEDGRDKLKYQKVHIRPEIGKGNKESFVYIKTDIYLGYFDFLKKWAKIEPNRVNKILSNQKTMWWLNKQKYSRVFNEQFFKVLGWRLPEGKSTHILRHSRATHLLQEGKDLLWVKEFMRHESVQTTEVYVHLAKDRIGTELNSNLSFS